MSAAERNPDIGLLALSSIALAVLIFLSTGLGANDLIGGDEGYYGVMARNILHDASYIVNPSLHPMGSPGDKPFLYPLFLAGAILTGGVGEVPLRLATLLVSVLSAVFIFLIGRELIGQREGFSAALLYLLTPFLANTGRIVASEPLLVTLSLAGFWLFLRSTRRKSMALSFISGILFGLAFLCKLWLAVIPLSAAIGGQLFTSNREKLKEAFPLALSTIAGFIASSSLHLVLCLVFTPQNLGHWLRIYLVFSLAERIGGEGFAAYWRLPWHYYAVLMGRTAALWLPLVPLGMVFLAGRRPGSAFRTLVLWIAAIIPISFVSIKSGGYILPVMPALFLLAGSGFRAISSPAEPSGVSGRGLIIALSSAAILTLLTQLSWGDPGGIGFSSPAALLIQAGWMSVMLYRALFFRRRAFRLGGAGAVLLFAIVIAGGVYRDIQIVRSREHVTDFSRIAAILEPALERIDPAQICFISPEWPSMSYYTFRSGSYWESSYVQADPEAAIAALDGEQPFFFVVETGGLSLYGGLPADSIYATIRERGHVLYPREGNPRSGTVVYVNSAMSERIKRSDPR